MRAKDADRIAAVSGLAADGIVRMSGSGFEVTPEGVPLLRVVAMCFDATLAKGAVAGVVAGAPGQHARVI